MQKHSLIALVMATLSEAKPFITGMALTQEENTPFPVFSAEDMVLIVCGIGKVNAAMGATYCCMTFKPDVVINLGAAGATDTSCALKGIYHISKIFEFDRPTLRTGKPHMTIPNTINTFNLAPLATQDRAILLPEERKEVARLACLVDMEAAPIAQVCQKFKTQCLIFKFVSDTPDHTEGDDIVSNIKNFRTAFYHYFKNDILPKIQK